jgi:hypothetical protein
VVDGLFDSTFVQMVHHLVGRLPFSLSEYDTPQTRQVLHWKHEFDLRQPPQLPLIPHLLSRGTDATTELFPSAALELQRVHCNLHLYGDIQNPHTDIGSGVTALYFANTRWETEWMGETVFYDAVDEPLLAVIPRPGRLVVFDADIVHRGGVPSRACVHPRLSLAMKFARHSSAT